MTMNLKTISLLVLALLFAAAARSHAFGWALVNAKIRSELPDVRRITTAELAAWLDDAARSAPLLLDVRTRAEFDVSHIAGARHVEPNAPAAAIRGPEGARDRDLLRGRISFGGVREEVDGRRLHECGESRGLDFSLGE